MPRQEPPPIQGHGLRPWHGSLLYPRRREPFPSLLGWLSQGNRSQSSGLSSAKAPAAVVAPGGAFTTGSRLIEKRQVGSIIGRARDQRDNTIQTAHRRGNVKSR